jgi:Protein of unknown function (DUF2630)
MEDAEILQFIQNLVEEEHTLRSEGAAVDRERLGSIEKMLDQCWDLLRQRRARREFGDDPDDALTRDERTVEGYQQ